MHIEVLHPQMRISFPSGYTDDDKIHRTLLGDPTKRKVREVLDQEVAVAPR